MAALWLQLLLAVGLPVAAAVAVSLMVYRRRRLPRNAPPELLEVAPVAGPEPTASPGLAKLNMRYSTASGRVGLRFHQLHQHQHHARVDVRHRDPGGAQQGPFQWANHPRLVTEAAENGWAQFVLAVAPPRSKSASSSPLWGTCPVCDAGMTSRDMAEAAWELPAGSSERMQAVRLNPAAAAAAASSRKWLPGGIPSPLRGDANAGNNPSALCLARMSLPLPGPPLTGAPFPQDAYFEITIIYLNTKRPEWSASRTSRRGRDGSSESDRVKLISFARDAKDPVQENRAAKDEQQDKQRHLVMSMGLAAAAVAGRDVRVVHRLPLQRRRLPRRDEAGVRIGQVLVGGRGQGGRVRLRAGEAEGVLHGGRAVGPRRELQRGGVRETAVPGAGLQLRRDGAGQPRAGQVPVRAGQRAAHGEPVLRARRVRGGRPRRERLHGARLRRQRRSLLHGPRGLRVDGGDPGEQEQDGQRRRLRRCVSRRPGRRVRPVRDPAARLMNATAAGADRWPICQTGVSCS